MNIKSIIRIVKYLPKSIYLNLQYFSIRESLKLPIILMSNVKIINTRGRIHLMNKISMGSIIIGGGSNPLYSQINYKCVWDDNGGDIYFGKDITFSKGVGIEIGEKAHLKIDNNVYFGCLSKISCFDSISIGKNTRFSWECIITDTDFHSTINVKDNTSNKMTKPIRIGKNNWLGIQTLILKGTITPDFCIAGARSLLNKKYDIPSYSVIGGMPAKFITEGIFRDMTSHIKLKEAEKLKKVITPTGDCINE